MPWDRGAIRDQVFGDRHGQRPRSFSGAVGAKVQRDEDRNDAQKHNGERNLQALPASEEEAVGGEFWTDEYFASTVGKHADEATIGKYVKNQGQEYQQLHSDFQPGLF